MPDAKSRFLGRIGDECMTENEIAALSEGALLYWSGFPWSGHFVIFENAPDGWWFVVITKRLVKETISVVPWSNSRAEALYITLEPVGWFRHYLLEHGEPWPQYSADYLAGEELIRVA
jgi:hypothetical protein